MTENHRDRLLPVDVAATPASVADQDRASTEMERLRDLERRLTVLRDALFVLRRADG